MQRACRNHEVPCVEAGGARIEHELWVRIKHAGTGFNLVLAILKKLWQTNNLIFSGHEPYRDTRYASLMVG